MKIGINIFLALFIGLVISSCTSDDTHSVSAHDENLMKLQKIVDDELTEYKKSEPSYPGGIALKVIHGTHNYFVSAGLGSNVTEDIYFRAASNTKTFTSTAILYLYQQGKLNLTDKITDKIPGSENTYVPNTPEYNIPNKSSITILDLLRHRAGVFDVSNDVVPSTISANVPYKGQNYMEYMLEKNIEHNFTFDELVGVVAETQLEYFKPNTAYHYSNTGYSLLGKIIERVSGKSYSKFLEEDVMAPTGMKNSYMPFAGNDQKMPTPYAKGYIYLAGGNTDVSTSNISANVAEGNIITTPKDLSLFAKTLLSGKGILNPHIVNSVMMNYVPSSDLKAGGYGCGLNYTNNLGYGHTGAHEGYLSIMVYDPENDLTYVAFTNTWNLKAGMKTLGAQLEMLERILYQCKSTLKN
jgi:D-alanyl-D-alanine carboxypeptidase